MAEARTIGLDTAKQVFQVHGANASGNALFRKGLTRAVALAHGGDLPDPEP